MSLLQKQYYKAILTGNRSFLNKGLNNKNVPNLLNIMMVGGLHHHRLSLSLSLSLTLLIRNCARCAITPIWCGAARRKTL